MKLLMGSVHSGYKKAAFQPASKMRVYRFAIREDVLFSILQGLEVGLREWTRCVPGHKNMLTLSKRHVFVIEKYVEDAKQDEKHVPDLLESIMRPTCLVKEKLRTNSCKSNGLSTRQKKKTSQAPAQARAPAKKD